MTEQIGVGMDVLQIKTDETDAAVRAEKGKKSVMQGKEGKTKHGMSCHVFQSTGHYKTTAGAR